MNDQKTTAPESVPGVQELFSSEAITQLENASVLCKRACAMRTREKRLADMLSQAEVSKVYQICQIRIAKTAGGKDEEEAMSAGDDPAAFMRAVAALPRLPSTAARRRRAREAARVYLHMREGSMFVPQNVEDFHHLWDIAMEGEPRWGENDPSSSFRTNKGLILDSLIEQNVLQICSDPDDLERELTFLLRLLRNDALLPEVRAVCGFALFEWIHPFKDGNGHTGRMLMLSALSRIYSLPSIVCFSSELVMERGRTEREFSHLRTGEGGLIDFCSGVFSQLEDAHSEAMNLVREACIVPERR